MNLSTSDLQEIRNIVEQVILPLKSENQALRNNIKDNHDMISELESTMIDRNLTNYHLKIRS
jgi:hypothetical protein